MQSKHGMFERLYGMLLYLYPKEFRAAYGQQMRLTFRDACRLAYSRNGTIGLLAVWLPTLLDLLKSALEERVHQGELTILKERLIALAGPLTILVGSVWLVTSIGFAVLTELNSSERYFDFLLNLNFYSFYLLFFALLGTWLRFHRSASVLGRLGLALSAAGCAGLIAAMLAQSLLRRVAPEIDEMTWVGYVAGGGLLSIISGYILFGVDTLRYKLLPRWNVMPLLVGSTILLSITLNWFGWRSFLPSQLQFAINAACWVLLGIALMDPRHGPEPEPGSLKTV